MARIVDLDNRKIIKVGRSGLGDVIYHISPDTPTIEPEVVRHGHWVLEPDSEPYTEYVCSVCGTRASSFIGGSEMWYCLFKPRFCPNCGTKMDKEDEE